MDQEKLNLHNTLIKQQELLLKQYETLAREKNKKEEEIDLAKWLKGLFKRKESNTNIDKSEKKGVFIKVFKISKYAFWKGIKYTFGLGIIGFIVGIGYYWYADPIYKSTMVISSGSMPNNYYSSLIFTLNELAENKSFGELSKKLNISRQSAENIVVIQYQDYLQKDNIEDDSTLAVLNRPFFRVYVEIKDNSILPDLQEGIFNYVADNNYTRKRREVKRRMLENNIGKLATELKLMDSLKVAVIRKIEAEDEKNNQYFVRETGVSGGLILSQDRKLDVDPLEAFTRSKSMHDEQQNALRDLLLIENEVDVVDDFAVYERAIFPRYRHIASFVILFGALGYLISLVLVLKDLANGKLKELL